MLLDISGEITPERMKRWSQSKNDTPLWMRLVLEARSDAVKSKVKSEAIKICNVRSTNQGKIQVVKQDMARVNMNTLGISELN